MKCSRKSTTWRAEVGPTAAVLLMLSTGPTHAQGFDDAAGTGVAVPSVETAAVVTRAIEAAVRSRVAEKARVTIASLDVRGDFDGVNAIVAVLSPEARAGERTRVALKGLRGRGRSARVGEAHCTINVTLEGYAAVAAVPRGTAIPETAIERREVTLDGMRLQRVASVPVGARATRHLAPGELILAGDVAVPPAVRSGEMVTAEFSSGAVQVRMRVVAAQDGDPGDDIRLVNPSSGRPLRGRVVAPGRVEVRHGT